MKFRVVRISFAPLFLRAMVFLWLADTLVQGAPPAKPVQPAPLPAAQTPVEPVVTRDGFLLPAEVTAYQAAFRAGQWAEASNHWQRIHLQSAGRADLRAALAKAMPSNSLVTVVFWHPCADCKNGVCSVCAGKKDCLVCKASGKCTACQGLGGTSHDCPACRCPVCKGAKRCATCFGSLWSSCHTCGGSGQGEQVTKKVPCAACKGTGVLASRINGKGKTCPTCRGARTVQVTGVAACVTCRGSGRVACGSCQGKGVCGTCAGRGRALVCVTCKATGRIFDACPVCKGRSLCPACGGDGRCASCNGSALCKSCAGIGAKEVLRLPAQRDWLIQSVGILPLPPPAANAVPRLFKLPIRTGQLNIVSDPSPPPAEWGKEWIRP